MTTETEIEAKFWKALKSDRTLMLGLEEKRWTLQAHDGAI